MSNGESSLFKALLIGYVFIVIYILVMIVTGNDVQPVFIVIVMPVVLLYQLVRALIKHKQNSRTDRSAGEVK